MQKTEKKNNEQTKISYHKIFPILGITLFFSSWFSIYSYDVDFGGIHRLFSGQFIVNGSFYSLDTWVSIITLVGLALIIAPFKDKNVLKWGALIALSHMLFLVKNIPDYPDLANHATMMTFLAIGYVIIATHYLIKRKPIEIFNNVDFLPLMRASLIIMYFFGTFHKINTDFLMPDGCWSTFYNTIPLLPDFLKRPNVGLALGGYGTLILEALALVMLFFPKSKYYGMLLGMSFHFLIGITTETATVAHFSAFAFALHMGFLSTDAIDKFSRSTFWQWLNKKGKSLIYIRVPIILFLVASLLLSLLKDKIINIHYFSDVPLIEYYYIKTMWVLYAVPIMLFVLLYGKTPEKKSDNIILSKCWLANIVTV